SYETERENGLSHFLEHLCFKGTERRPSAKILAEEIESMGAVTNAFTDREYTGYYIKGNPSRIDAFFDILSDIYQHPTFPEDEIEKEKGVIIEEINMYEDMPQQKVADILFAALYPGQAAGRSVLGTKETVRSFKRADLLDYQRRFYTPENTVIVCSGNVSHAQAVSQAQRHFGMITSRRALPRKRKKVIDRAPALHSEVLRKPLDQGHFMLALRSLPLGHKNLTTVRMLATILGRGMSSRLSLLLREELGAAYYVYAQQESYPDHGLFLIGAGVDRTRLPEIMERVADECRRLKTELVSETELAKAKEYSIGTFSLGLELSDDIAVYYGIQLVLRRPVQTPEEQIAAFKKVTAADIRRAAKLLFVPDRATFALIGPFSQTDAYVRSLKQW
ncbi:MAG TPA: pitrilysin family protein, partial [Candidatus Paceibacterota bacterium]